MMTEPVLPRSVREKRTVEEKTSTFVRWVKSAGGHYEPRELPLTPAAFLNPRIGDSWAQGKAHIDATAELFELLRRQFRHRPDVLVLHQLKHLLEPGLAPAPDISIVLGAQQVDRNLDRYKLATIGFPPSFILEVLSPFDSRLRQVDKVDKARLYARIGVKEYFLEDLPRGENGWRCQLEGYRLDDRNCYHPIDFDAEGRLESQTTGLLFSVSPAGDRLEICAAAGEHLLSPVELEDGLRREKQARKAAEAEVDRLRREIERLRCGE